MTIFSQIQQAILEKNAEIQIIKPDKMTTTPPLKVSSAKDLPNPVNEVALPANPQVSHTLNKNQEENESVDLNFFKENEGKIVYIQSGFRGYKARKDLEQKNDKTANPNPEAEKIKKNDYVDAEKNNISQNEGVDNNNNISNTHNNSKYFDHDKEVVEFGKISLF